MSTNKTRFSNFSDSLRKLMADDLHFNQVFIRAFALVLSIIAGLDWIAELVIYKNIWALISYPTLVGVVFVLSAAAFALALANYDTLAGFLLVFGTLGGSIGLILVDNFSDRFAISGIMFTLIFASQVLPRRWFWLIALISWVIYAAAYILRDYPDVIGSLLKRSFGTGIVFLLLTIFMYLIRLLRDERMNALSTANQELTRAIESTKEAIQVKRATEDQQTRLVAGLRAVIAVTDELMAVTDVETLYRRAVELARDKLNVERCAIFIDENDKQMKGTYGTDLRGSTTNESTVLISKNDDLIEALAKLAPGAQQWISRDEGLTDWNGSQIRVVGVGWNGASRIHSNGKTLGIFFNDAAISHTALDVTTQEIIAVFCSILGKIIERKQMEQSLRHGEEQYRRLFNEIADTVLIHDLEGALLDVNEATVEHLGYTRDELLHMNTRDIDQPDFATGFATRLQQQLALGKMSHIQGVHKTRSGDLINVDINSMAIIYNGQRAILSVCRDITEQKQVEQELRDLNQLKTEFLSTAAHELRTPLVSIVGFSELMISREMDANRSKHFVEIIHEQSVNLGKIIDSLLDISRLESKQLLALNLETVNLAELLAKILTYFAEYQPKYQFKVEGMETCPPIAGDPFRLTQVLQNLYSNAIKYSPDGGTITIRGQLIPDYIQISVQDQGIGMTAQQQAHLFERFYRADSSNTTISGTGLGLAICKLIVELHGGRIWAESEYQAGTTIFFTLPVT